METVFVKEGSSKSYTNLITSSAPHLFDKKKKKKETVSGAHWPAAEAAAASGNQ